jgi:hypothetical protein
MKKRIHQYENEGEKKISCQLKKMNEAVQNVPQEAQSLQDHHILTENIKKKNNL